MRLLRSVGGCCKGWCPELLQVRHRTRTLLLVWRWAVELADAARPGRAAQQPALSAR